MWKYVLAVGAMVSSGVAAVGRSAASTGRGLAMLGGLLAATFGFGSHASAAITLPATGVDLPGHITAATTALGVVVVAAVGAWFAFWVIKAGLSYARRAK